MSYWKNGSGCYDPVLAEVINTENRTERLEEIKNEHAREKQVHDTIVEIKNILKQRDLKLGERIVIEDKKNNKVFK